MRFLYRYKEVAKVKRTFLAAIALATIAAPGVATAQSMTNMSTPYGLRLRAGIVFGLSDEVKNTASAFLGIGADYSFEKSLFPGSETYLSVDWITKTSKGHVNVIPIMLGQRFLLDRTVSGETAVSRGYAFLSAGPVIIDAPASKTTRIGLRAGFGLEFNEHMFGEFAFLFTDRQKGTGANANTVGIYAGYKF